MAETTPIVCSFHTPDDYYREHGERLRRSLDRLGVEHEIREIAKAPGQDWADICRKKIAFLAEVCEANPGRRVFWIDVDCNLLSLPDWVRDFSADLLGFQRGFGSPLTIGYDRRTRFWEPCFFGISPSPQGRKFIADAARLERVATVKATDDYFFEEAWRANAAQMSFQVIPSTSVVSRQDVGASGARPFFSFGSSGNVAAFKGKVVQHDRAGEARRGSLTTRVRRAGLASAKRAERALPEGAKRSLRRAADSMGLTALLTGGAFGGQVGDAGATSPARQALVSSMIARAQRGEVEAFGEARAALEGKAVPTHKEQAAIEAAESFLHHATRGAGAPLPLAWWPRPFPGNFGDWLSPLIVGHASGRPVTFQPPTSKKPTPHLVGLGSIGRFVERTSTVVGTGVSSLEVELAARASWVSVRGPLTAQALRASGGPDVERFGDPGVLLRRAVPLERGETNGRVALVRHYTHLPLPVELPDGMDEVSLLVSHPHRIEALLAQLVRYDRVVTSAMHVMIACHSYGIPCALVTFEGLEDAVHGSGIKYEDYALGVGIHGLRDPHVIGTDLTRLDLDPLTLEVRLSDAVLDDAAAAIRDGVASLDGRLVA
ncbi:polysaccharide pyruvyl transferase family protein [Demequina sp. NBRC 110056]|uniref:polysaccharide pyruvyl transferase family protein n=1 Tax=Demequina sp. NBRC 110056 TaxID=1570345 RepID=UPI000A030D55|nr:polysaccharide pyruvyl transferase family protein [Demequina sp. NBRC 110056]